MDGPRRRNGTPRDLDRHRGGWAKLVSLLSVYVCVTALLSLPITRFLKWAYRVRVTGEGIHGGTVWSTPVYMSFAEMETVEPRSLFGLSYLRVKSFRESCPTLWIPRFLADPTSFRNTIVGRTSPTHPLRKSLENGNTAETRQPVPYG